MSRKETFLKDVESLKEKARKKKELILRSMDADGDGEVNEDEFMRIMTYKHSFKAA